MQQANYRIIFHIDMNCFFASCEIAQNPDLKGVPLVVARDDVFRKSIILTATYEARKYGIYTTMLVKDAIKLCPNLVIVEPNYQLYSYYSKKFFDYLYTITNKIEPMSIDEGFMDVTDVCKGEDAIKLANTIQAKLLNEFNLPCSIGIAPNKFLAKTASDMKKPLGITILRKREVPEKLWPLPIEDIVGIGKKTAPKLHEIGIHKIGDIANFKDINLLQKTIGTAMTEYLRNRSLGIDNNPVNYENLDDVSSVSNSTTFDFDQIDDKIFKSTLKILNNSVSYRMEKDGYLAYTIGVQIKYNNFHTINRSRGLDKPINDSRDMYDIVCDLFDENYDGVTPIRLLGVFATRLKKEDNIVKQYTLFDDFDKIDKENNIQELLSKINNQFSTDIINFGYKNKGGKK